MEYKYRIGQMVRIVANVSAMRGSEFVRGGVFTITGFDTRDEGLVTPRYEIDAPCAPESVITVAECALRPIYDGDQKISWADMAGIWQPETVRA